MSHDAAKLPCIPKNKRNAISLIESFPQLFAPEGSVNPPQKTAQKCPDYLNFCRSVWACVKHSNELSEKIYFQVLKRKENTISEGCLLSRMKKKRSLLAQKYCCMHVFLFFFCFTLLSSDLTAMHMLTWCSCGGHQHCPCYGAVREADIARAGLDVLTTSADATK